MAPEPYPGHLSSLQQRGGLSLSVLGHLEHKMGSHFLLKLLLELSEQMSRTGSNI